jgi:hypothetical protein
MTPVLESSTREPKTRLMVDVIETAMPSISITDVWVWVFVVNRLVQRELDHPHRSMILRSVVQWVIILRRVCRVVSQISNNKISILFGVYLVDLRGVFQVSWIAYFSSASGQQLFRVKRTVAIPRSETD